MKNYSILILFVVACGNNSGGSDDGVDANGVDGDAGYYCGDGACNDGETPASCMSDCMEGGPVCGDSVCNGTETPLNCASDCGTPACTAANDNCTDETICIAGVCEAAFPRTYVITNVMVSLAATNQGAPWDTDATAPDLYVADITVPSSSAPISPVVPNSLTPTFAGPFEITLTGGIMAFRIDIWDDDSPPAVARQIAFSCSMSPASAYWLRPRTWGCAYNNSSLTLTVNPKP